MKHLENHLIDPLTGLKNRLFAEGHLHNRLLQVQKGGAPPFPLLFLDKDTAVVVQKQLSPITVSITVSIGATVSRPENSVDTLVYRVRQLAHESKTEGGGDIGIG